MKAPNEIKRWIAIQRKYWAKKNGVVSYLFDAPKIEVKLSKNKKIVSRKWGHHD